MTRYYTDGPPMPRGFIEGPALWITTRIDEPDPEVQVIAKLDDPIDDDIQWKIIRAIGRDEDVRIESGYGYGVEEDGDWYFKPSEWSARQSLEIRLSDT